LAIGGNLASPAVKSNVLYYGDNLDILRRYLPPESVDLVYLDPPFNSSRDFNVIFKDESGRKSDAQLLAFEDTWHWGPRAEGTYAYLTNTARHQGRVPEQVSTFVAALRKGIGENQMMAYLVEMSARLVELHRVLTSTGSLYLHCDPTASHYLKVVLDAIFGPRCFRSEIVWKRSSAHSDTKQGRRIHGHIHDVLLFYTKTDKWTWNPIFTPYDPEYLEAFYRHVEPGSNRRYRLSDITGPGGAANGNPKYPVMGVSRYWRYSPTEMERLIAEGRVIQTSPGTVPAEKRYLDEMPGVPLQDVWSDLKPIGARAAERLGYPTQKPLALLERIISTSSNPGDLVLDPFCGCGTAIEAAHRLQRRWIGIDVTYLAMTVMRNRMRSLGLDELEVIGQPTEVEGARQLAQSSEGRYQFQWWALGLVGATPVGGVEKKGADRGIDGVITFTSSNTEVQTVLASVKSGHVGSSMIRDLKGTLEREKAAIGLFVTLEEPSREMKLEAATAGAYTSELYQRDFPRIQILTIKELLAGRKPDFPPLVVPPLDVARKLKEKAAEQIRLFDDQVPVSQKPASSARAQRRRAGQPRAVREQTGLFKGKRAG
jgi:DNA modification methylase